MKRSELLKLLNLSTFTAFDFETTGLDSSQDRVIEVAAIRFENGEITKKFVQLINPEKKISAMITRLTGISNKMVRNAPTEEMVIDDLLGFIGKSPLVAHNIHFDQKFLIKMCERLGRDAPKFERYDTLQLARTLFFQQPVFNLGALSEYFGLSSEGSHRAEKDTENTGLIFLEMLDELANYPLELISKVNSMLKGSKIPNQQLYINLGNELTKRGELNQGLRKNTNKRVFNKSTFSAEGNNDLSSITAKEVFGNGGLLSSVHPNFEERPNQIKYSELIENVLVDNSKIGVIEAGTGLGKSMAYLFGAYKSSSFLDSEGPTIIACHTKPLQDQLFYKDLPQLSKALDVPIKAIMLKGRRNYICKTRLNWLISDSRTIEVQDLEALLPIVFWMHWTKTGDLSECSGFYNSRRTWLQSLISSEPGFCTGDLCKKNDGCYYGKLKKNLFHANIIIVNHSLLMTDVAQPGFLPDYKNVIIDEAHNLVKSAYDQFRVEWNEQQVNYLLQTIDPAFTRSSRWNNIINKISDVNKDVGPQRDALKEAVKESYECLKNFMKEFREDNKNKFSTEKSYQDKPIVGSVEKLYRHLDLELGEMKKCLTTIFSSIDILRKTILEIDNKKKDFPSLHSTLERSLEVCNSLLKSLIHLTENHDPEYVYWLEGDFKSPRTNREKLVISMHSSLVDVSETINTTFFQRIENCVLTSATLKIQDSFGYFLKRIGIDQNTNIIKKEFLSPFHYNEQVIYHQYGGNREISNDPTSIGDLVFHLHKTLSKRIMVLFTSVKALTQTASYLKEKPGGRDLPLFAQIKGASRPAIIKGMHQKDNGILFGTNSFWEGVDLPGDLLEILILVKLPFDVPSEPLVKSYSEYINRQGGNSFMEYNLPEAAIRFRQGFGRLIRTSYDAGRFICLDNRIVLKRYGTIFSKSLPVEIETFSEMDSIR